MAILTRPSSAASHDSENPLHADVVTTLIENRRTFLHGLIHRVKDQDIAEEVLQQFYLRAITRASDVKQRESILPRLYRVLSSTPADCYRSEQSRRRGESEYARFRPNVLVLHQLTTEGQAPCSCFHQLLPILTPAYAEVLQRIDLGGDSQAQVAKDLGITLNSFHYACVYIEPDRLCRNRSSRHAQAVNMALRTVRVPPKAATPVLMFDLNTVMLRAQFRLLDKKRTQYSSYGAMCRADRSPS